jgi:hypothetical protein
MRVGRINTKVSRISRPRTKCFVAVLLIVGLLDIDDRAGTGFYVLHTDDFESLRASV